MTLERSSHNPILTRHDIPDIPPRLTDVTSVFNPAATRFGDAYLLMLRVQSRGRETFLLMAESENGVEFAVRPELVEFRGMEDLTRDVYHIYDPRITEIDGVHYVMFAADMDDGCRLGVGRTTVGKYLELFVAVLGASSYTYAEGQTYRGENRGPGKDNHERA